MTEAVINIFRCSFVGALRVKSKAMVTKQKSKYLLKSLTLFIFSFLVIS